MIRPINKLFDNVSAIKIFALIFVLQLAAWQLLSPPFTGGDEPWHVTRTWSAIRFLHVFGTPWYKRTQPWMGGELKAPAGIYGRSIKNPEIKGWPCFFNNPEIPATCATYAWDDDTPTADHDPHSEYPPLGYLWMGLPTLFLSGAAAYYSMRAMVFLAVILPVLVALYAVRKNFSPSLLCALVFFIPPSVLFQQTGVSLDGPVFGSVLAAAIMLAAALRDKTFLESRLNFNLLIVFSWIAILLKSTAAVSVGTLILLALIMRMPRVWGWIIRTFPAFVAALALMLIYPFSVAGPPGALGLAPGTPLIFNILGSVAAVISEVWTITLSSEIQTARVGIAPTLPYAFWAIVASYAAWGGLNRLSKRALTITMLGFAFFVFASSVSYSKMIFMLWQARYGWPMMVAFMVILLAMADNKTLQKLPLKFGWLAWSLLLCVSSLVAYNRFYRGVIVPKIGDWWQGLTGVVGRDPIVMTGQLWIVLLFFVGSILLAGLLVGRARQGLTIAAAIGDKN